MADMGLQGSSFQSPFCSWWLGIMLLTQFNIWAVSVHLVEVLVQPVPGL